MCWRQDSASEKQGKIQPAELDELKSSDSICLHWGPKMKDGEKISNTIVESPSKKGGGGRAWTRAWKVRREEDLYRKFNSDGIA